MLICWRKYISKGGLYRPKTTRFRAILVESVCVDGKWRHKHVAVVGSFVAETLDIAARCDFWRAARQRLSIYVKDGERARIDATLARRVPPPTAAEEACGNGKLPKTDAMHARDTCGSAAATRLNRKH
jgi:hypothetical protein